MKCNHGLFQIRVFISNKFKLYLKPILYKIYDEALQYQLVFLCVLQTILLKSPKLSYDMKEIKLTLYGKHPYNINWLGLESYESKK